MVLQFPDHEFRTWLKKPTLLIEGYKSFTKQDGSRLEYFYCCNKKKHGCQISAKALNQEDESNWIMYEYKGQHSEECHPSSALISVKKVRDAIKERVLADPTLKPTSLYNEEVFKVRDQLSEADRVEFDNLMPTRQILNASIFKWKRRVIPPSPECIGDLDVSGPFFTMESGESIVK